jgi:predicted RNase H-like HicB family nuclease
MEMGTFTRIEEASVNREEWLSTCIGRLRADFEQIGFPLPEKIRASCSWPSKSGLAQKKRRIGEAWSAKNSGDSSFEVFISPVLKGPIEVSATVAHELVHCAVGLEDGHKGRFPMCAKKLGLEGKMTATHAGETLAARLKEISDAIGPYPHAELKHSNAPPKQSTRMMKVACKECGCVVRMTRKWLDEVGAPTCACGGEMAEEDCE